MVIMAEPVIEHGTAIKYAVRRVVVEWRSGASCEEVERV
jgi:hypothetical protein